MRNLSNLKNFSANARRVINKHYSEDIIYVVGEFFDPDNDDSLNYKLLELTLDEWYSFKKNLSYNGYFDKNNLVMDYLDKSGKYDNGVNVFPTKELAKDFAMHRLWEDSALQNDNEAKAKDIMKKLDKILLDNKDKFLELKEKIAN